MLVVYHRTDLLEVGINVPVSSCVRLAYKEFFDLQNEVSSTRMMEI